MSSLVNNVEHEYTPVVSVRNETAEDAKYRHYRAVVRGLDTEGQEYEEILPNGGATIAYHRDVVGGENVYRVGVAYCNPKDNYCKRYGRAKAQGRLRQYDVRHFSMAEDDKHLLVAADSERELLSRLDGSMEAIGYLPR